MSHTPTVAEAFSREFLDGIDPLQQKPYTLQLALARLPERLLVDGSGQTSSHLARWPPEFVSRHVPLGFELYLALLSSGDTYRQGAARLSISTDRIIAACSAHAIPGECATAELDYICRGSAKHASIHASTTLRGLFARLLRNNASNTLRVLECRGSKVDKRAVMAPHSRTLFKTLGLALDPAFTIASILQCRAALDRIASMPDADLITRMETTLEECCPGYRRIRYSECDLRQRELISRLFGRKLQRS